MCSNWNILSSLESSDFDPFQVFEVDHDSCQLLRVTVLGGEDITMGRAMDMLDTPDPYVLLSVPGTGGARQRTICIDNCTRPIWNQEFEFLYDAEHNKVLEVSLVDANVTLDYVIGTSRVDISDLRPEEDVQIKLTFAEKSVVHLRLKRESNTSPDLRYSLALCDAEKEFRCQRRQLCMQRMNAAFGDEINITSPYQVPTVAMLGSGGGFRAMIAMCGVYKALRDSGLLEMSMYLAGLSGSSWFVSQLYADQRFPYIPTDDVMQYFRGRTGVGLLANLGAQSLFRYTSQLVAKSVQGQPVSFTDLFGLLLADTLQQDSTCTLTRMRERVCRGQAPLPLFTSLHVKKNVSAKVFQEWVEFTPFEIGIPKYGTFMDAGKFGSRFFKGKIAQSFPEYPLHFLQGIWGSAFTILFKRLVNKPNDGYDGQESIADKADVQNLRDIEESIGDSDLSADEESDPDIICQATDADQTDSKAELRKRKQRDEVLTQKKTTLWTGLLEGLMGSNMLNSRAGRAGAIFNPLYGLRMLQSQPLSPFMAATTNTEPKDEADFSQLREPMDTDSERLLLVDAGLTFNSPYPALLRPQRGVDLYISFDFSGRDEDHKELFSELELAETWARKNQLPFPDIAAQARVFERQPLREVYVFRGQDCPTILHFVLVNTSFRKFKAPGVPRTTAEELEFADFSLFSGGQQAFSTLNFCYSGRDFDRLSQLTEYNTLLHLDLIRAEIKHAIIDKQRAARMSFKDIVRMKMLSKASKQKFITLVQAMQGRDKSDENSSDTPAAALVFDSPVTAESPAQTDPHRIVQQANGRSELLKSADTSECASGLRERFHSAEDEYEDPASASKELPAHGRTEGQLHQLLERFLSAQEMFPKEQAPT